MLISRSSVASLPESGYVRQANPLLFVPVSKFTLRRRVIDRTFPPPVEASPGVTDLRVEDVRRWMAAADVPLDAPSAAVVAVHGQSARQAGPPSGRARLAAGPRRLLRSARSA